MCIPRIYICICGLQDKVIGSVAVNLLEYNVGDLYDEWKVKV